MVTCTNGREYNGDDATVETGRHGRTAGQVSAQAESEVTAEAALRALADSNRRRILAAVRDQPRAVGEIAEQVGMSQQTVSHHLRVLRGAGLVTERRERTRHLFLVRADGLEAVRDLLDGFWPTRLAALKRAAEGAARSRKMTHG